MILNELLEFILVGLGAFLGGCLRGMLGDTFNNKYSRYPWGTLLANVIGCFLIGIIAAKLEDKTLTNLSNLLLAVGFCGGLTTFSTFSLEVYQLLVKKKLCITWSYWIGTTLLCLTCVRLGMLSYHMM